MGEEVNPRLGVISDTLLQGSLLANAAKALGYDVVVNTQPGNLDTVKWVDKGVVECWLIDLHDQEKWAEFLDLLHALARARLVGQIDALGDYAIRATAGLRQSLRCRRMA